MDYADLHHGKTASEAGYDCLMRFFMWKYSILRMMIPELVWLIVLCIDPFFGEDQLMVSPVFQHRIGHVLEAVLFKHVGGRFVFCHGACRDDLDVCFAEQILDHHAQRFGTIFQANGTRR